MQQKVSVITLLTENNFGCVKAKLAVQKMHPDSSSFRLP